MNKALDNLISTCAIAFFLLAPIAIYLRLCGKPRCTEKLDCVKIRFLENNAGIQYAIRAQSNSVNYVEDGSCITITAGPTERFRWCGDYEVSNYRACRCR